MNSSELDNARAVALLAADAAQETIADFQSSGNWQVDYKADDSPVTAVDIASEKAIRKVLAHHYPEAAFYGEETGQATSLVEAAASSRDNTIDSNEQLWLVDPIDGTKSFIRNMPFFSTQIALQSRGELVVGVSNAPAFGERLVASVGAGVTLNDVTVQCRNTTDLAEAFLSTGNLGRLAAQPAAWNVLAEVFKTVRRVRGYGDFCHYHQLCCGQADLIIESDVNILDIAALTVGVREAGGVITDLLGQPISLSTTSVLAAGTAELHASVLSMFANTYTQNK